MCVYLEPHGVSSLYLLRSRSLHSTVYVSGYSGAIACLVKRARSGESGAPMRMVTSRILRSRRGGQEVRRRALNQKVEENTLGLLGVCVSVRYCELYCVCRTEGNGSGAAAAAVAT